ncbi:hypothetical protein [Streptomyces sp. NPDC047841]
MDDLRRNEDCGESTADGEGHDPGPGSRADRTARAESPDSEDA